MMILGQFEGRKDPLSRIVGRLSEGTYRFGSDTMSGLMGIRYRLIKQSLRLLTQTRTEPTVATVQSLRTVFARSFFADLGFRSALAFASSTIPLAFAQEPELELPRIELILAEGLEAKLFASEPMIQAPTNMDIDHRGRVWINEGVNYREIRDPRGDRIMILEDVDGDGIADTAKEFYRGNDINAAMGICVLGNSVIVSSAPNIILLTDTDGDDKADEKVLLFSGIGGIQHDHSVHAVVFGPDGKLYFPIGNTGAVSLDDGDGKPVRDRAGKFIQDYPQGKVYRCDLDGSNLETLGWNFRNPYEVCVDSFGNLWQSDNDDGGSPAVRINQVFEFGDHGYRPMVRSKGPITGADPRREVAHWHQNDPGVVPNLLLTGTGAPTGIAVYEGDLLPPRYRGQLLHADAGPNIVRSYSTKAKGAGYEAETIPIAHANLSWFRPSDVTVAPDGSIFVTDWLDPACGGHRAMATQGGRIYRISPPNTDYAIPAVDFSSPDSATKALTNPASATRFLAWQALVGFGRQSQSSLERLYAHADPRMRARALWLLAHPKIGGVAYIDQALKDGDPNIRLVALRATRRYAYDLFPRIESSVGDVSPHVLRECATALRTLAGSDRGAELWAQLAQRHVAGDRWSLEGLGIGSDLNREACFESWIQAIDGKWNTPAGREIVWRLKAEQCLPLLAEIIASPQTKQAERERCFRAFDFFSGPAKDQALLGLADIEHPERNAILSLALKHLEKAAPEADPKIGAIIDELLNSAKGTKAFLTLVQSYRLSDSRQDVLDMALAHLSDPLGYQAIRVLVELKQGNDLLDRTFEKANRSLQSKLTNLIGSSRSGKAANIVLKRVVDPSLDAGQRLEMVRALNTTSTGARGILGYMERGEYPQDIWDESVDILVTCAYANVVDWATAEIVKREGGREPVNLNQLLAMPTDSKNGKIVFERSCFACHKVGEGGFDFGPNLSHVGAKLGKYALFDAIMNPSAGIEFNFEGYEIELENGQVVIGTLTDENDSEIMLKLIGGIPLTITRAEIKSIRQLATSLMPEGLERTLAPQDFADLVGYLTTLK